MRHLIIASTLLIVGCGTSQSEAALDPAELLTTHFGGKPSGSPLNITWKPQGEEAERFETFSTGMARTTVDTILYPEPHLALVLFRTEPVRGDDEFEMLCSFCEDQLGLAVYQGSDQAWTLVKFEKWFAKQGVYSGSAKPDLLAAGTGPQLLRIISNDGEPDMNTTTHHLFGIPGLQEAFAIATMELEVDRESEHGPMPSEILREYRFIPSDNEWSDLEVDKGDGERVRWTYSSTSGTYIEHE